MEYKFTDSNSVEVAVNMTLADIASLISVLDHAASADGEVANVSRWRIRQFIKALRGAQASAAETLRYDAESLAKLAKSEE